MFLKIVAQGFEAGNFLNIFLRFLVFWGSFSYKNFSYKKRRVAAHFITEGKDYTSFLISTTLRQFNTPVGDKYMLFHFL